MTVEEPVWSIWNCSKCKPLKTRSFEDTKKAGEPLNMNMNPRTCPYKYIEFLDKGGGERAEKTVLHSAMSLAVQSFLLFQRNFLKEDLHILSL